MIHKWRVIRWEGINVKKKNASDINVLFPIGIDFFPRLLYTVFVRNDEEEYPYDDRLKERCAVG